MKSLEVVVGMFNPSTVRITNKQNCVEYQVISGFASEREARRAAGNFHKSLYQYDFDGYYMNRKEALTRLEQELEATLRKAEELKCAINVTKKKVWKEV